MTRTHTHTHTHTQFANLVCNLLTFHPLWTGQCVVDSVMVVVGSDGSGNDDNRGGSGGSGDGTLTPTATHIHSSIPRGVGGW